MISVNEERCTLCGACLEACPWEAISLTKGKLCIDQDLCRGCAVCLPACPFEALYEVERTPVAITKSSAAPVTSVRTPAIVVRSAASVRVPSPVYTRATTTALWVTALPVAMRFAGGLANWWLDQRRLTESRKRESPVGSRNRMTNTDLACSPRGGRRLRRRLRGGNDP
jgi:Fe-S-cluster-containing hydrogenase component 2